MASKPYGRFRAGLTDQPDPSSSIITFIIPIAGNPNTLGLTTDQLTAMALDTTTGNQWFTVNGSTWTQISGAGGTLFASAQQQLNVNGVTQWTFNHGLGALPSFVRAVTVSLNGDLSYPTGHEVGIESWAYNSGFPLFSVDTSATAVVISATVAPNGNESQIFNSLFGGNQFHMGQAAFWALKVYAKL